MTNDLIFSSAPYQTVALWMEAKYPQPAGADIVRAFRARSIDDLADDFLATWGQVGEWNRDDVVECFSVLRSCHIR
jgi:hypothetical protein